MGTHGGHGVTKEYALKEYNMKMHQRNGECSYAGEAFCKSYFIWSSNRGAKKIRVMIS
jgi:hypothetical protein